jgi:hypothetical protein
MHEQRQASLRRPGNGRACWRMTTCHAQHDRLWPLHARAQGQAERLRERRARRRCPSGCTGPSTRRPTPALMPARPAAARWLRLDQQPACAPALHRGTAPHARNAPLPPALAAERPRASRRRPQRRLQGRRRLASHQLFENRGKRSLGRGPVARSLRSYSWKKKAGEGSNYFWRKKAILVKEGGRRVDLF